MNGRMLERMFWGLIIVGIGVLFLLRQMDVGISFDIGYLFRTFWPVFLIIPGIRSLIFQRTYSFGQSIGSLVLIGIGTIFLLRNLGWFFIEWRDLFSYAIPIAIILFGLSFIFRGKKECKTKDNRYGDYSDSDYHSYGDDASYTWTAHETKSRERNASEDLDNDDDDDDDDYRKRGPKRSYGSKPYGHEYDTYQYVNTGSKKTLNKSNFIGDVYMGQDGYWELQPLNISHFIGDTVIDLTKASVPYGETKITVNAFIGDVKMYVPHDADIEVKVIASSFIGEQRVFNRREGGMFGNMRMEPERYYDAPRKIKITVSMFIGDVVIQRVG